MLEKDEMKRQIQFLNPKKESKTNDIYEFKERTSKTRSFLAWIGRERYLKKRCNRTPSSPPHPHPKKNKNKKKRKTKWKSTSHKENRKREWNLFHIFILSFFLISLSLFSWNREHWRKKIKIKKRKCLRREGIFIFDSLFPSFRKKKKKRENWKTQETYRYTKKK